MMLAYDKINGNILGKIPDDQDIDICFLNFPESFRRNIRGIILGNEPLNFYDYKIIDEELVELSEVEKEEKKLYGTTLTAEERLLNQLRPTQDEVQKAENTIELLSLLREVM